MGFVEQITLNDLRECFLKIFYKPQMQDDYDEIRVPTANWTTSILEKTLNGKEVKSLAVIGHCDWDISWQVTSLFSHDYYIQKLNCYFHFFFSGYKSGGKRKYPKYPQNPDAIHSRYGTIRKWWEERKWVARLNRRKTYMTYAKLGLSGRYLKAIRCVQTPP